jgi:hypothetical protein
MVTSFELQDNYRITHQGDPISVIVTDLLINIDSERTVFHKTCGI